MGPGCANCVLRCSKRRLPHVHRVVSSSNGGCSGPIKARSASEGTPANGFDALHHFNLICWYGVYRLLPPLRVMVDVAGVSGTAGGLSRRRAQLLCSYNSEKSYVSRIAAISALLASAKSPPSRTTVTADAARSKIATDVRDGS